MSRAKFDKQQVVGVARDLFWQYGYHALSMQELVKGTGLKPGSLYLAFDNKEGLFAATLEDYITQATVTLRQRLASSDNPKYTIRQILEDMIEESTSSEFCSCFLVKSQLELAKDSDAHGPLLEKIKLGFEQVEAIYCQALSPEFGDEKAAVLAANLMLHIFGLRVYGYHNRSQPLLRASLASSLPWLPWQDS